MKPTDENVTPIVLNAFRTTLQIDSVDPLDDFFELGGDSLAAIQLVSMLEEAIGVDLGVEELFDYPTPTSLADRVLKLHGAD